MKGKVLGFDPVAGTGAITGDDGKRYSFIAAENKSSTALKAGDTVDFQVDGEAAKDIYAVAGGAANVDLAAMASNPTVAGILAKPTVIWAAIVILGALIAGYLNAFSMMNFGGSAFLYILLFALPIIAGVQIYFELTNHKLTSQFRLITGVAAVVVPVLVPMIVGSGTGLGGIFGGLGAGGDWFGFNITLPKILMVGGGALILMTHFGMIKKLG